MGGFVLNRPNSRKSLTEGLMKWFSSFSESMCCVKIGRIENVNTVNQTVDVTILHKRRDNTIVNKVVYNDYAMLKQVPFVILGGGGSNLTFPITKGDNCLLLFCDYEIDRWWDTGESLPANFERRHDISDAFALVGVRSMVDLIQGYSQYVKLKYSDSSYIEIGEEITLNNDDVAATGKLTAGELHSEHGATGVFTNFNGNTLTIVDGIITKIT